MKIIILKNYEEISKKAAQLIANQINTKDDSILGLATGSTSIGTYKELIILNKKEKISFKKTISFNLDEYVGIKETNNQSYRYFMNENLFNHININKDNTFVPSGIGDIYDNSIKYERLIKEKGPIDLQLLGIGTNAHIGFCEPGSPENGRTSKVNLSSSTIKANKRFFKNIEDVPKTAISMGIASINDAKSIILLASGENKAEAIKNSIEGNVTIDVPASLLQNHPNVTFIIDKAAASKLSK